MALTMNLTNVQREQAEFKTETGKIVTLTDAKGEQYFREMKATIVPVQSGSGDPSPDNVRPISGFSEAKVTRTGKNLLPGSEYTTNPSGGTSHVVQASGIIPAGTVLTIRGYDATGTEFDYTKCQIQFRKGSVIQISRSPGVTVTFANDVYYDNILYYTTPALAGQTIKLQAELGSTATDYEPYQGEEVTVQLGQTVYGGTLDVRRGKVRVTHQMLDFSAVAWTAQTRSRWFYNGLQSTIKKPASTAEATTAISDTFPAVSNDTIYNDQTLIALAINANGSVVVRNGSTTDQPTGHMVYELAEPFEITVTPEAIKTLVGENNVWADTGEIEVTYKVE